MPLVLTRKIGESIVVDGPCTITLTEILGVGRRVRLFLEAPQTTRIHRAETLTPEEKELMLKKGNEECPSQP